MRDGGFIGDRSGVDQALDGDQAKEATGLSRSLIGFGALLLLSTILGSMFLGRFDNTTELTPNHDNVLLACFVIAGLCGLASAGVAVFKSKALIVRRRAALAFCFGLLGFLSAFLVSSHVADIVEGWIDFPPRTTRSYPTLLSISRAYQTHGKGRSWNIQTTPIWSNLEITEHDYEFMLSHRRVGDDSHNPDEISSNGHFCAKVTIQQSAEALRVMHAGSHKLPEGTVIICQSTISK